MEFWPERQLGRQRRRGRFRISPQMSQGSSREAMILEELEVRIGVRAETERRLQARWMFRRRSRHLFMSMLAGYHRPGYMQYVWDTELEKGKKHFVLDEVKLPKEWSRYVLRENDKDFPWWAVDHKTSIGSWRIFALKIG
ncbi:uncharacterized protein LOC127810066 isoform X2 [Diospyros lotus]|uniref:uncharacterized protein LOC127810066 isoform X2 n=1 Tax=Diospyros lotus TaxID=55363 RepID=UPI002257D6FE|nr:uncharacterized protein LOC127810066 isoform X2 [Diospyros lotus]